VLQRGAVQVAGEGVDGELSGELGYTVTGQGVHAAASAAISLGAAEVLHAVSRLPGEQRRAVLAAAVWGRTALEISRAEGVPLGTAKTRIRRGLLRLRATLGVDVDASATVEAS
jgi:RNA polymerase sigma-70 factor (ECF subfamily)